MFWDAASVCLNLWITMISRDFWLTCDRNVIWRNNFCCFNPLRLVCFLFLSQSHNQIFPDVDFQYQSPFCTYSTFLYMIILIISLKLSSYHDFKLLCISSLPGKLNTNSLDLNLGFLYSHYCHFGRSCEIFGCIR